MEQDTTNTPPEAHSPRHPPRRLTRSRSDRMVAGVCGGIADYFGIDALLVRIGFVVATFFGGTGALAYGIVWLVVPEEGRRRAVGHRLVRSATAPSAVGVVLVVVGAIVLLHQLTHVSTMTTAVTLLVAGIALLLWTPNRPPSGTSEAPPPDEPEPPAAPPPSPPPPPAADDTEPGGPPPAGPRRPRSPLGRYVLSSILVMAGVVGILDAGGVIDASLEGVLAGALVLTGGGLLVGAKWGRARGLIALGILLTVLLGGMEWIDLDLDDGWGERHVAPDVVGELEREYRLSGGELRLDLSRYPFEDGVTEVSARVAMGELLVVIPSDMAVTVEAESKMGHIDVLGDDEGGINVERRAVIDRPGPELRLDLKASMGQIEVRMAP